MALTSEGQQLVERNIGLAFAIAGSFGRRCRYLRQDYFGAALLALTLAADSFDGQRTDFSYWATRRIVGACKDLTRQELPLGYRAYPKIAPRIQQLGKEPLDSLWDRSYGQVEVTANARATA